MNCTICNSSNTVWFTPEIRKCNNCSSLFRTQVVDYTKEYINKNYWFDITKPEWAWVPIEQENQANFIKRDLVKSDDSVLVEFGCANGYIAQCLSKFQFKLFIQELVDIRVQEVKDNSKILFLKGTFEDVVSDFEPGSITNIVMNNVIEHINDIHKVFRESYRLLENKGRFIIVTDDGDNPFGSMFAMLGHPEHCFCITKKGITGLCEKYNFSIVKYWQMTDYLSYIVLEKND